MNVHLDLPYNPSKGYFTIAEGVGDSVILIDGAQKYHSDLNDALWCFFDVFAQALQYRPDFFLSENVLYRVTNDGQKSAYMGAGDCHFELHGREWYLVYVS